MGRDKTICTDSTRLTHVRYLPSSSANSLSMVRSTCPVFCINVVPARDAAFLNLYAGYQLLSPEEDWRMQGPGPDCGVGKTPSGTYPPLTHVSILAYRWRVEGLTRTCCGVLRCSGGGDAEMVPNVVESCERCEVGTQSMWMAVGDDAVEARPGVRTARKREGNAPVTLT